MNLPLLAELPLEPIVREGSDSGLPAVLDSKADWHHAFRDLAEAVSDRLGIFRSVPEVM